MDPLHANVTLCKYDANLGLVLGWAIICTEDGEPYIDLQDDHIPEDAMLKAASDFMVTARKAKGMHEGDQQGQVVFAFPITEDIKTAFGIDCPHTGLMIAMRPEGEMLAKFKSGEYTGFSIGGVRIKQEDAERDVVAKHFDDYLDMDDEEFGKYNHAHGTHGYFDSGDGTQHSNPVTHRNNLRRQHAQITRHMQEASALGLPTHEHDRKLTELSRQITLVNSHLEHSS